MNTDLVLALSGGAVVGIVAKRVGVPGGAIIGSLVGAAIIQLATGAETGIPAGVRLLAQGALGAVIGARFEVEILAAIRRLLAYAVPLLTVMMGSAVAMGLLFALVAGFDPPIGVLATIPGGSGDVIAVALDLGEDAAFIASVHLSRQILVFVSLGLVASVTRRAYRRRRASAGQPVVVWCAEHGKVLVLGYASPEDSGWYLPRINRGLEDHRAVRQATAQETGLHLRETEVTWHQFDPAADEDAIRATGLTGRNEPAGTWSVGAAPSDDLAGDGVWLELEVFRKRTTSDEDLAALNAWADDA